MSVQQPPPGAPERIPEMSAYARLDLEIISGDGVVVVDRDQNEYLDLYGGHAAALLGYRHPRLLKVLNEQAERLFFQTNLVEVGTRQRACAALSRFAPEGLDQVFLVNSGAEAVENALRLAFASTGRSRVVALERGFHGRTAAAGAVTSGSAGKWYRFPETPFAVSFVPGDDLAALDQALDSECAALILEPVQGVAGAVDLNLNYLRGASALCAERGVVFIADEIQCGMGRSGRAFAIERAGVTPDIITAAKGLAGGFPAGAVIATEKVAASVTPGSLGTTFGGGPMAAALMECVIQCLEEEALMENAARLEAQVRERCCVGPVSSVQGAGLLLGLRTTRPAKEILGELRTKGILVGGAADPNVMRLMPPLIINDTHVDALAAALQEISP